MTYQLLMFVFLVIDVLARIAELIYHSYKLRTEREELKKVKQDLETFRPVLIGFSGKAGCGKSTIAKGLIEGYEFIRLSFAAELKSLCMKYFPSLMAEHKEQYRKLLQWVGDGFRQWNSNVWVNFVIQEVNHHLIAHPAHAPRIVIDDLRYKNEFWSLENLGFLLVRVERDPALREKWGYNVNDTHISEVDLDDLDFHMYVLNNWEYPFEEAVQEVIERVGL